MWSDNEADIDLLGFQHLLNAVMQVIKDDSLLPATIGVFGDWGSGKSSLLRMVEREIKGDKETLVIWFNGWLFEGYEDAKTALMGTIIDEIVSRRTLGDKVAAGAKKVAFKLLKRIQIFRLIGIGGRAAMAYAMGGGAAATASVTADGVVLLSDLTKRAEELSAKVEEMKIEDIEQTLKTEAAQSLRRNMREFRDDFEELLKATHIQRLVVLIDDLDRCMPDTIIETLEAIKLFLFVPRTAFVIGADESLVRYAVRRRFPELTGEKREVGRDYLEKLVQYPVRVPALGRAEMETYINLLYTKNAKIEEGQFEVARKCVVECKPGEILEVRFNQGIAEKVLKKVPPELAENLALAQRIAPILATGLAGNPRQCKRFLNTLVMRVEMAKSRGIPLKERVLAKLMVLEYFHSESFKQLAKAQMEQRGRCVELAAAEEAAQPRVRSKGENPEGEASERPKEPTVEMPTWLSDPGLKEWLASEPKLSEEDLRPYFFFARDTLGPMGHAMQRMSPAAQDVFVRLFQEGKANRANTLKKAAELSPGDATAVFEAIAQRSREEEDSGADDSALMRLTDWMGVRRELFGQGASFLSDMPEENVPVSFPPRVANLARTPEEKILIRKVIEKWSKSTKNQGLRGAAGHTLAKL